MRIIERRQKAEGRGRKGLVRMQDRSLGDSDPPVNEDRRSLEAADFAFGKGADVESADCLRQAKPRRGLLHAHEDSGGGFKPKKVEGFMTAEPSALPGGNRQRFALSARSLLVRPSSEGEGFLPSDRAKSTARRIRACSADPRRKPW